MALRAIRPDRLTLALLNPQRGDNPRTEEKHKEHGRGRRATGPEGEIAKHI